MHSYSELIRMGARMLLRDWRAGELRVMLIALIVAVASVTSVSFFTERIKRALEREAHQLIGADFVLSSDKPTAQRYIDEALKRGLTTARVVNFPSMVTLGAGDQLKAHLAGVKTVSTGYPLRGTLRTASALNQPDARTRDIPQRGTVWLDEQLTGVLGVKPGDRVQLGDASFAVDRVLTLEPDRGASFFAIAPRLMLNSEDLPSTNLIQVGSRVVYRLLVAGEDEPVKAYAAWVKAQIAVGKGEWLEEVSNARPEVRATSERANQFLGLVALLAVILASVAIALAARRFTMRHLDSCAVMRCLGATQSTLTRLFLIEFMLLALAASLVGCLIGFGVHAALASILGYLVAASLPAPTLMPALQGFATGVLLLIGFALPPLLQLANVPPVRVIRRETGLPQPLTLLSYSIGLAGLVGLLVWQSGDVKLGLLIAGGFIAALALFSVIAWGALSALARARHAGVGVSWRYGLAAMQRRAATSVAQIVALGLGLMAMLMLTVIRGDLVDTWRKTVPADAPNRFLINVQPEQRAGVLATFAESKLTAPEIYPMIRGRLVAVNGKPVTETTYTDQRARRNVDRELNLSTMAQLPGHNKVVAGTWFGAAANDAGAFSVEEGIAKTLNVGLGDELTFEIGGQRVSARISSLRKLNWDSMRANFFVIGSPGLLDKFPTSYISAFNLPVSQARFTDKLIAKYPNLSVVDVGAIVKQVQTVIEQVVKAVQFVFFFTLAAGVVVLYAALNASQDERVREAGIMRALGAQNSQLRATQLAEFALTGLLAGLFAACGAAAIGYAVGEYVLQLPITLKPSLWLLGIGAGLVCSMGGGWLSLAGALKRPAMVTLREAT